MSLIEGYQLYISSNCHSCKKVLYQLKENEIKISVVNIDTDNYQLPFKIMVIPALVKEKRLIGYGYKDILQKLETT